MRIEDIDAGGSDQKLGWTGAAAPAFAD